MSNIETKITTKETIKKNSRLADHSDALTSGALDYQERPPGYEQQGRDAIAAEYHEANLDLASSLMDRINNAVDGNGVFETPGVRATRVELPQPEATSVEPAYRYEVETVLGKQDRLSTTITVINGRPELTYYAEPVDTVTISPAIQPARYESGSWTPEDTAIDYVEQSLNEKLSMLDTILSKELQEKSLPSGKRRLFGRRAVGSSQF